jgi:hypothetical protein
MLILIEKPFFWPTFSDDVNRNNIIKERKVMSYIWHELSLGNIIESTVYPSESPESAGNRSNPGYV